LFGKLLFHIDTLYTVWSLSSNKALALCLVNIVLYRYTPLTLDTGELLIGENMASSTIKINGRLYDSHTGIRIMEETKQRQAHKAGNLHRRTQNSKTLNRRYISNDQMPKVVTATAVKPAKAKTQHTTHPSVRKFAPQISDIRKVANIDREDTAPIVHPTVTVGFRQSSLIQERLIINVSGVCRCPRPRNIAFALRMRSIATYVAALFCFFYRKKELVFCYFYQKKSRGEE
jgi:hypothetical protein